MAKANGHPRPVGLLSAPELDRLLESGERRDELVAYFGEHEFDKLARLKPARRSAVRRGPGGGLRRVYVLPGIMGSTLGTDGETIWVNFWRLARGRAVELSLGDNQQYRHGALDVIPYVYYFLRRRLAAEGFEPVYFPYDWRLDLPVVGQRLAAALAAEPEPVDVIGHSMGGLVARLALRDPAASAKVARLVMMGTPNFGSFEAVRLFDGGHGLANRVADLDFQHSRAELLEKLFVTLPGVYQLLPHRRGTDFAGLYDAARWPARGAGSPRQDLLTRADAVTGLYPPPDERHYLIASTDHETTSGVAVDPSGVTFVTAPASGDGTVPLPFARLPGVKTKLVGGEHMWLPKDDDALDTVVGVLNAGSGDWADDGDRRGGVAARRAAPPVVLADRRERLARAALAEELSAADEGAALEALFRQTAPAEPSPALDLVGGLCLERPRRRLEVTLARGSLADAEERVGVVGLFQNVHAGGAAGSIDAVTGGAVTDLRERRMFDAQAGQVFILPTPTRRVGADFILLLGLGKYDELTETVYRFAAANVVRTLVRSKFRELATVVPGTNSTLALTDALRLLLTGFLTGLTDADPDRQFRRITICEIDRGRQDVIKRELIRLSSTGAFGNADVVLNEVTLAAGTGPARSPMAVAVAAPAAAAGPAPTTAAGTVRPQAYLSVRTATSTPQRTVFRCSLLMPGGLAAVPTLEPEKEVPTAELDALLARFFPAPNRLDVLGAELAAAVLPPSVREALGGLAGTPLTVVNDAAASRVPWEALPAFAANGTPAALAGGVNRLLAVDGLAVTKWTAARRAAPTLRVMLVIDPTGDLDGAKAEGDVVAETLANAPNIAVEKLVGPEATRARVREALGAGRFDAVHYAGHAQFDKADLGRSGLDCADGPLTARDVADLTTLPALLVFNACESGRVRMAGRRGADARPKKVKAVTPRDGLMAPVSFAEAFLRNGVAQFVGTYWPVDDRAAEVFGATFYRELAGGATTGAAVLAARQAVKAARSNDWADYIHYGDPLFALKVRG